MKNFAKYFKKRWETIVKTQNDLLKGRFLIAFNFVLIIFQAFYLWLRVKYVSDTAPFWFTQTWGDAMFAPKYYLFIVPVISLFITFFGLFLEFLFRIYFVRFIKEVLLAFITLSNLLLTFSLFRIILVASVPFPPLVNPLVFSIAVPLLVAFLITVLITPWFISLMFDNDIVTNPKLHQHPAMILQKPSARGGGALYAFLFVIIAIAFVGIPDHFFGLYVSLIMLGTLGFFDDFQNTHTKSSLKSLENPVLRLLLQIASVAVLVFSGVVIKVIGNPWGGVFDLTNIVASFAWAIPMIFTILWIAWFLNLLSWSNGIDGQYSGIIGIVSIFICILALRFSPLLSFHRQIAMMAAISAGISFGLARYTWFPSKILWGFGATAAGIVVTALSILINTKIIVSILILLIPFLDAVVTLVRRILQKKNPLVGDRGHMHHLLLDMGWSVPKIALFYWVTTFAFGMIGLFSSDRYLFQTVLILGGIVAFVIVLINLRSLKKQRA